MASETVASASKKLDAEAMLVQKLNEVAMLVLPLEAMIDCLHEALESPMYLDTDRAYHLAMGMRHLMERLAELSGARQPLAALSPMA